MNRFEQETIVRLDEESLNAEIYTASRRVSQLLLNHGLAPYKLDKYNGKPCGWYFRAPKTAVLIKPGKSAIKIGGSRKIKANAPSVVIIATPETGKI